MEAVPGPGRPPGPDEKLFQRLVEAHQDAIVVLGEGGVIQYANPSAAALLGPGPAEGARLADLVGDAARAGVRRAVGHMLGGSWQARGRDGTTWRIAGPDGRSVHVEVRCSDLSGPPAADGVMLSLRDVTAQRAREDELHHRAWHDPLTGLPNRELFEDRVRHALADAGQARGNAAVLYLDLDGFKPVNDTLGHRAGDELLRAVGARLAGAARKTDTAARVGGDEFAVLLEGSGPDAAGAFAGRIVEVLGEPYALTAGQVRVSASVGVATTADSRNPAEILARADRAMYAVKNAGVRRGGWLPFDASMTAVPRGQGRPPAAGPVPAAARPAARPDTPWPGPPAAPDVARLLQALLAAPGPLPRLELARCAGVGDIAAYRALGLLAQAGWLSAAPARAAPGSAARRPAVLYVLTGPGRAGAGALAAALGPDAGRGDPAPEI